MAENLPGIEPMGGSVAVRPGTLKTVEDCAAWIYEHDGRISAWWEAQRDENARTSATVNECQSIMRVKIDKIDAKIDEMNKTIYKATGAATLGGALIGIGVTVAVAILNGG
jgi:hypothetical protein